MEVIDCRLIYVVAQNPKDPQAQKELAEAHKYLLDKLHQIRKDAHIIEGDSKETEEEVLIPGSEVLLPS